MTLTRWMSHIVQWFTFQVYKQNINVNKILLCKQLFKFGLRTSFQQYLLSILNLKKTEYFEVDRVEKISQHKKKLY